MIAEESVTKPRVVDFVNNPADTLDSFRTNDKTEEPTGKADPTAIFDLAESLVNAGLSRVDELERVAATCTTDSNSINHQVFRAPISPTVARWSTQLRQARFKPEHPALYSHGSAFRPAPLKLTNRPKMEIDHPRRIESNQASTRRQSIVGQIEVPGST